MFLLLKVAASADLICDGVSAGARPWTTRLSGRADAANRPVRHDPQI